METLPSNVILHVYVYEVAATLTICYNNIMIIGHNVFTCDWANKTDFSNIFINYVIISIIIIIVRAACVNYDGNAPCTDLAASGQCQENPVYMVTRCRSACGACTGLGMCR